jgi:hypothetical protein
MHLGQNMLAIKVDHAPLIRLARVNVHCCSAAEKFDQRFGVNIGVGTDRPFAVNLLEWQLGGGLILNRLRISNVEVALERFGQETPEFGRSFRIFLVADETASGTRRAAL